MTDPREEDPRDPEVGSVGEEAAKLLDALTDWAGETGAASALGSLGSLGQALVGQAGAVLGDLDEHVATGAPECTYCPICRTVHVVRESGPEVAAHLSSAAVSLLQALRQVVASLPPSSAPRAGGAEPPSDGFERIDLDDDWSDDEDHL